MLDLTLLRLRLGPHSFDIRFVQGQDGTMFEALRGDPAVVVRRPLRPH